jgi:phosphoglycerate dehydrogenase-like enzyme
MTPMFKVAFVGTFAARLEDAVRKNLTVPCEIIVIDQVGGAPGLGDVDVLVTLAVDEAIGRAARSVRLVQVPGAGLDRIDRSALPAGAFLANAYGHENGIAEYAIGAIVGLTRDFVRLDAALRVGDWQSQWAVGVPPPPVWPELAGRTVGILGYGRIGRAVARKARAFDMNVCAISRKALRSRENGTDVIGGPEMIDELLIRSDYVVISMPATPATVGCLGRGRLALMKPTAFLINVARAEIVDEDALYEALAEHRIAGAALDVWYRYPTEGAPAAPATRPFHQLPNVLMTPHIAGWTDGMLNARALLIAENIARIARGEIPLNLVEP